MSDNVKYLMNAALLFGAISPEVGAHYAALAFRAQQSDTSKGEAK